MAVLLANYHLKLLLLPISTRLFCFCRYRFAVSRAMAVPVVYRLTAHGKVKGLKPLQRDAFIVVMPRSHAAQHFADSDAAEAATVALLHSTPVHLVPQIAETDCNHIKNQRQTKHTLRIQSRCTVGLHNDATFVLTLLMDNGALEMLIYHFAVSITIPL